MKRGKRIKVVLPVLLMLFLVLFSGFALAVEKDCVYYFYGDGDEKSEVTNSFMDELQSKYGGLEVHRFEIYYNKEDLQSLQDFFDAYEVPEKKQGPPVVFLSQSYFVGEKPITDYLENAILSNKGFSCPSLNTEGMLGIIGETSPKHLLGTLTFFKLTGAAIVDSVDVCALAILLILLMLLLILEKKKKILSGGAAFISGVGVAYLLLGVGVLGTLTKGYYFHKIIGGLAVGLGLTIIIYLLGKGKVILREIQEVEKLKKAIKGITFPVTVFLLGFIFSLFGFSTVRKYFSILTTLIADQTSRLAAVPLLVYYIILFVLPLAAVTWLMYHFTKEANQPKEEKKVDTKVGKRKKEKNARLLHLIVGIVMVILGLVVLL